MSSHVPWRAPQAPPSKSRGAFWMTLVIAGGLLALALLYFSGDRSAGSLKSFEVPKGASLSQVAQRLEAEGFITSARGFLAWAKLSGGKTAIRPGIYALSTEEGTRSIL